jgi:hypothetical protein
MENFLFMFGGLGGGYVVAVVFLLIASFTPRKHRIVWSVTAWVSVGLQVCASFVLLEFAGLAKERDTAFNTYTVASMIFALVVTGAWSYFLFRRPIPV